MTAVGRNSPRIQSNRETTSAQNAKEKQTPPPATSDDGFANQTAAQTKAPVDAKTQAAARGRVAANGAGIAQSIPEPNRLAADVKANGLETNQDLINHAYKQSTQGLQNSEENFGKAGTFLKDNYNVDINQLVANRGGKIDTAAGDAKPEVPTADHAQAENTIAAKNAQANVPTADHAQAENTIAAKNAQANVPTADHAQAENTIAAKNAQANVPTADHAQAENTIAAKNGKATADHAQAENTIAANNAGATADDGFVDAPKGVRKGISASPPGHGTKAPVEAEGKPEVKNEAPGMLDTQPYSASEADVRARSGLEGQLKSLTDKRADLEASRITPGPMRLGASGNNARIDRELAKLDPQIDSIQSQLDKHPASALDAQSFRHNQLLDRYNGARGIGKPAMQRRLTPQLEESFKALEQMREDAGGSARPAIPEGGILV